MKKLIIFAAAVMAMEVAVSCKNSNKSNETDTDSTTILGVDSVMNDSLQAEICDSTAMNVK